MPRVSVSVLVNGQLVPATLHIREDLPEDFPEEFTVKKVTSSHDKSCHTTAGNTFALERECKKLVRDLLYHPEVAYFKEGLESIQTKLFAGEYVDEDDFGSDVRRKLNEGQGTGAHADSFALSQTFECGLSAMKHVEKPKKRSFSDAMENAWEPPDALKRELLKKCALHSEHHILFSTLLKQLDDSAMVGCLRPHAPQQDQVVHDRLALALQHCFPVLKEHHFNITDYQRRIPAHYRQHVHSPRYLKGRCVLGLKLIVPVPEVAADAAECA